MKRRGRVIILVSCQKLRESSSITYRYNWMTLEYRLIQKIQQRLVVLHVVMTLEYRLIQKIQQRLGVLHVVMTLEYRLTQKIQQRLVVLHVVMTSEYRLIQKIQQRLVVLHVVMTSVGQVTCWHPICCPAICVVSLYNILCYPML